MDMMLLTLIGVHFMLKKLLIIIFTFKFSKLLYLLKKLYGINLRNIN